MRPTWPKFWLTPERKALTFERVKVLPDVPCNFGRKGFSAATARYVGSASEICVEILRDRIPVPLHHVGLKTHDYELFGQIFRKLKGECKAQITYTSTRPEYEVNVSELRWGYQLVEFYIFTRAHHVGKENFDRIDAYDYIEVCGYCTREQLLTEGVHHNEGDLMPTGRRFTEACHSIAISKLRPLPQLWHLALPPLLQPARDGAAQLGALSRTAFRLE